MKTRSLIMILVLAISAGFGLAQQPQQVQHRPIERPLPKLKVHVIDIRTATAVQAKAAVVRDSRIAVRPLTGPAMVAQALTVPQLKVTLHDAGLNDILPTAEYARFSPAQLSVEGKGHMLCQAPLWADPSEFIFDTSLDENQWFSIRSGPKIALQEAGAFVLDFLIKIQVSQPGTAYRCDVLKGDDVFQEITLTQETPAPQHLLVVFQQGVATPPQTNPWVGIRIHSSGQQNPPEFVRWTLFEVVVTKI
jgi:hypothetical protein